MQASDNVSKDSDNALRMGRRNELESYSEDKVDNTGEWLDMEVVWEEGRWIQAPGRIYTSTCKEPQKCTGHSISWYLREELQFLNADNKCKAF